jgi:hypothetical protein
VKARIVRQKRVKLRDEFVYKWAGQFRLVDDCRRARGGVHFGVRPVEIDYARIGHEDCRQTGESQLSKRRAT